MKTFVAIVAVVYVLGKGSNACQAPDFSAEPAVTDPTCSVRPADEPLCSADPYRSTEILHKFMGHHDCIEDAYILGAATVDGVVTYWCSKENITMRKIEGRHQYIESFADTQVVYNELCTGSYETWYQQPGASDCFTQHWERFVMHSNYDVLTGKHLHHHKIDWFVSVDCRRDHAYETDFFLTTTCLKSINNDVKQWIAANIPHLDIDAALAQCTM